MSEDVRSDVRDGVAWLTFDRPRSRNAMTFAMYEALYERALAVNDDPAVRALILTGTSGAFVAGTDISQFGDLETAEQAAAYEARMDRVLGALEAVRVPTIAAIGGATTGGGLAIAAACDLRVASAAATFGMPIARTLGNCLSIANLARVASLIGLARTKELVFTARIVGAEEALQLGIVHEVVAPERLLERAEELARHVAAHAPLTLWATKEGLRRLREAASAADGSDLVRLCYTSADFREGVSAFLAKRRPEWRGR